mgnify:CR=1 FL=1
MKTKINKYEKHSKVSVCDTCVGTGCRWDAFKSRSNGKKGKGSSPDGFCVIDGENTPVTPGATLCLNRDGRFIPLIQGERAK